MIHYKKGNLFESEAEALVNTVNTVGVMGKGLALQFKEIFPNNYKIYRDICKNGDFHIGQMLITEESSIITGHKIIINFPTKTHWKYPSEYSYIQEGLAALYDEIKCRGIKSVAIPPLGSHNGGLEWDKVKKMIEYHLHNLSCDIYIYEPSDIITERLKNEKVNLTPARALLILMIAELNHEGEFASVFAAEKLIYFMQKFGAKDLFKIDFKPYIYGPYSGGKVAHVLYYLNGSYIKGMTAMSNRPFDFIWLTDDAESEASKFIDKQTDEKLKDIYERTSSFLKGFYSNYSLELLSSVDYLLENSVCLKNWRDQDEKTIIDSLSKEMQNWSQRKERMFTSELMCLALRHIKSHFKFSY